MWSADDQEMDPQEFASLLDLYDNSFRNITEGEVVKGTVLSVSASAVIVDVGFKSEGMIPLDEFLDENGEVIVQPGDTVDVLLERTEDRDGHIVLSRQLAQAGHYPAVDVLASVSRLVTEITSPDVRAAGNEVRKLMATYKEKADLISIGAYQAGSDPQIDAATIAARAAV